MIKKIKGQRCRDKKNSQLEDRKLKEGVKERGAK